MISTLFLFVVAAALYVVARRRGDASERRALAVSWAQMKELAPRIALAILAAGFIAEIMPAETVAVWLGGESGLSGILLATAIGCFVPSGPMVSFPIALGLYKAGVGLPQLVAFITGWSVLAAHRALIWELPMMGWGFLWRRFLVSLPLGPLAGIVALLASGKALVW
jgi:uncharacterized membrane protein YraQ (UPF0718 family)